MALPASRTSRNTPSTDIPFTNYNLNMKNKSIRMAVAIMLLCPLGVYSQNSRHAFEFGLEGSAINHTRIMVSDFHQTRGGDYVFTLEEKQLYGGSGLYAAYQLNDWIYLDGRATLGIARYYDSGNLKQGFSVLAGPGL